MVTALFTLIPSIIEGIQKGKPFIDDLLEVFKNHDIQVRDENISKWILEADAAKAEIEAEIAARAARG